MLVVRQAGGGIVVGRARDQDRYDGPRSPFAGVEFADLSRQLLEPGHFWRCHYSADELRNLQRVASDGEHTA
jgi:hypothetical protein